MFLECSKKIVSILVFSLIAFSVYSQHKINAIPNDSLDYYIQSAKNKTLPIKKRLSFTHKLYNYSQRSTNDSLKNIALKQYVKFHYQLNDSVLFKKYKTEYLNFLNTYNDSLGLAKTYKYSGILFEKQYKQDSAFYYYYKSYKTYNALKDSLGAGKMLLYTAVLEKNVSVFMSSENTSFHALSYLLPTQNNNLLASVYNNLGVVYNNLKDFDNALMYHQKSLELNKLNVEKPEYQLISINNIGKVLKDKKEYAKAITNFNNALNYKNILKEKPKMKAVLIDNLAHARFKNGEQDNVLEQLLIALKIREHIKDDNGILISCIHLAEYYKANNKQKQAIRYAERAEKMAKKTKEYRDYLESLNLLVNLYNGEQAKVKFNKYTFIRDSLDVIARHHKDQFARIKFDVDVLEIQIKTHKKDKRQNYYIILVLFAILVMLLVFYYYAIKNRKQQDQKLQEITQELTEAQRNFFHARDPNQNTIIKEEFKSFLITKYKLTKTQIEFWQLQAKGLTEAQIAAHLQTVTEDAIKKRRTNLYKKLKALHTHLNKIDKFSSVSIYREAFQKFEESY